MPRKIAPRSRQLCEHWPRPRATPAASPTFPTHLVDDPDTVVIYEQYRDDAALAAHRDTAHFETHAVGVLFQRMRDRSLENLIALA